MSIDRQYHCVRDCDGDSTNPFIWEMIFYYWTLILKYVFNYLDASNLLVLDEICVDYTFIA